MKRKYSLPVGILLLLSITYLCTSYIPSAELIAGDHLEPGHYELKAHGNTLLDLQGMALFSTRESLSKNGTINKKLEIQLMNMGRAGSHCITILMNDSEFNLPMKKGSYSITENIKGFLNQNESVFGFADIELFGELPYFTKKGEITIFKADNKSMSGRLMLVLNNASGEIIELEGTFLASNKVFK